MSLFTGAMRLHVDGKKELTNHSDIVNVTAGPKVYIPYGHMPAVEVLVKPGDQVYVGTKIAQRKDHFTVPVYSSVSGTVVGTEKRMHAMCKMVEHIVIENDGKFEKKFDITPLDWQTASVEELVEFMMNMGLVGCGGAGFPTYVKYRGVKGIETLIINGVECEPFITSDHRMIDNNTALLVSGVQAMKKMCGANKAYICIKEPKADLIAKVREALAGVDGVEVKPVPDVYPMGWERTLVYQVLNKRYNRLPSEIGVVVNNATTAISFARCLATGEPIVTKMVTFSGDALEKPCNVLTPVGVPVGEILAQIGGINKENVYLIAGGPMMGRTVPQDKFVIGTFSNAITVLENKEKDEMGCLRCGRCVEYCPSGLQPVRINTVNKYKDVDMLEKSA